MTGIESSITSCSSLGKGSAVSDGVSAEGGVMSLMSDSAWAGRAASAQASMSVSALVKRKSLTRGEIIILSLDCCY